jgi:hypothetical protein
MSRFPRSGTRHGKTWRNRGNHGPETRFSRVAFGSGVAVAGRDNVADTEGGCQLVSSPSRKLQMRPNEIIVSGRGDLYPYLQLIVDLEGVAPSRCACSAFKLSVKLGAFSTTRTPRSPPALVVRYPPPTRVSNSWISPVISANSASFRRVVRPCLSDAQPADAMVRLFSRLISTPACRSRRSRPRRDGRT